GVARVAIAAGEAVARRAAGELAGEQVAGLSRGPRAVRRRGDRVVPGDDLTLSVEPGADVDRHRGALGLPAVLVVSHPLDADGLAHRAGEERGVAGHVVSPVVAV